MAQIECPKCKRNFSSNNTESFVTRGAAAAAVAAAGAWFGAEIGIVGGPVTGIAGTLPGAIVGGLVGWFAADQVRRCPHCGRIFKT
jgi:hypothetical protein